MTFKNFFISGIWLLAGVIVLGVSLVEGQKSSVWNIGHPGELLATDSADYQRVVMPEVTKELPRVEVLPGEWNYYPKVAQDWVWWRLAYSDEEKGRRLMQLASERLKAGWVLCNEGQHNKGLETIHKGEIYLSQAISLYRGMGIGNDSTLIKVAMLHEKLLKEMESNVPEEMRPRFTELINIPNLVLK